jgi:hypothetical protein
MLGADRDSIRESVMAKKTKKPLPRKRKAVAKPKAKAVKRPKVKRAAAPRKKAVRRKSAGKPESRLEKIENALLVGLAEADDIAMGLGLLAASQPPAKSRKKRR